MATPAEGVCSCNRDPHGPGSSALSGDCSGASETRITIEEIGGATGIDCPQQTLLENWHRLFEADRHASAWQHPAVVEAEYQGLPNAGSRPLIVLTAWRESEACAMAVLLPKQLMIRQVTELGGPLRLNGYRLAGSRVLGSADDATQRQVLLAAVRHMRLRAGK